MTAFVSGSRFGVKAATRIGIFVALTLGFPFLVYGIILATNARSVEGAAGALAVVAGLYLKPFFVAGLVISMIRPCWQRTGSLGLPPYWGLLVPLLILMDAGTLMIFGTHWGTAFALGILSVQPPYFALLAVVLVIAMSLARPPSGHEAAGLARFGNAGTAMAALGITLLLFVALRVTISCLFYGAIWFARTLAGKGAMLLVPLLVFNSIVSPVLPLVCVLFAGAVVWVVVLSRQGVAGDGDDPGPDATAHARL